MDVVGNGASIQALTQQFPSVALLVGPPSVGKWSAAEYVRREKKIFEPDVLRCRSLGIVEAREIIEFASTAPANGVAKVALVSLDKGTSAGFEALLKTLEDVPEQMHYLLTSSTRVPPTLVDRAQVYPFGLLSVDEVKEVLITQRGMTPAQADRLAHQSGGQISTALQALLMADEKATVLAMVRALREDDLGAVEAMADRWRAEHTELLVRWAHESVSQQWRLFNEAETGDVGRLPLRVLMVLRRDVRPRLTVRSLLADLLRGGHA